jgi:transcriptional regulator with XRE-family HTH domain
MNFREPVKKICKERGITQKELAAKLNIQTISLHNTLRGQYPQLQTLERIAAALEVHITDLFEQPHAPVEYPTHTIKCPHCDRKIHLQVKK